MRKNLFLPLLMAALGFAPAPVFRENLDPASARKQLQGIWSMSRYDRDGRTMILEREVYTVTIEKGRWTFFISRKGSPLTKRSTFTLKLTPKIGQMEIDLVQGKTRALLGVYDLKGDRLRIVFRATTDGTEERACDLTNPAPGDEFLELERKP